MRHSRQKGNDTDKRHASGAPHQGGKNSGETAGQISVMKSLLQFNTQDLTLIRSGFYDDLVL